MGRSVLNMDILSLTVEQQFQIKLVENSTQHLSKEEMRELLIQLSRLLMKDNAIRNLLKNEGFPGLKA